MTISIVVKPVGTESYVAVSGDHLPEYESTHAGALTKIKKVIANGDSVVEKRLAETPNDIALDGASTIYVW